MLKGVRINQEKFDPLFGPDSEDLTSLVRLRIQGQHNNLLVDTGATRSVIDWGFAKTLGTPIIRLRPGEAPRMLSATKTPLQLMGKCLIDLETDRNKIQQSFLVVRNLSINCLVGLDFVKNFSVLPNYEQGRVFIRGLGDLDFVKKKDFLGVVRLAQGVHLPPREISSVNVILPRRTTASSGDLRQLSLPLKGVEILGFDIDYPGTQTRIKLQNNNNTVFTLRKHGPVAVLTQSKIVSDTRVGEWGARTCDASESSVRVNDIRDRFGESERNSVRIHTHDNMTNTGLLHKPISLRFCRPMRVQTIIFQEEEVAPLSPVQVQVLPYELGEALVRNRVFTALIIDRILPLSCTTIALTPPPFLKQEEKEITQFEDGEKLDIPSQVDPVLRQKLILEKDPKNRTFEDLDIIIKNDKLSEADKKPFKDLIESNSDLFALSQKEIGKFTLYKVDLEPKVENPPPLKIKVYPQSLEARTEIEKQVKELLEADLIEESTSPWAVNCFLVRKSDTSKRLVYNCKPLNSLLKDQRYLTPTVEDCIEKISSVNGRFFIKLDLRSAFNHLELTERSRPFSAFRCHLGTFAFKRLLFGNKASPAFMAQAINITLSRDPLVYKYTCCYVDDIVLFHPTLEGLLDVLRATFNSLRECGFRLNNTKCVVLPETVEWCGHFLSESGVGVETQPLAQMLDFKIPTNKKELKTILGSCSYFRKHLIGYCHDAAILQELLKSTVKFRWTSRYADALARIVESLRSVPTLAFPDESPDSGPMILTTDASTMACGGFLMQASKDRSSEVLLACYGRSLRENERKWNISELETLSVLIGLEKFRHLLLGKHLIIRSDSRMVRYIKQMKINPSSRQNRWLTQLAPILEVDTTTFEFVPGKMNLLADYLSRKQNYPQGDDISDAEKELIDDELMAISPKFSEEFYHAISEYKESKTKFYRHLFLPSPQTSARHLYRKGHRSDKRFQVQNNSNDRILIADIATSDDTFISVDQDPAFDSTNTNSDDLFCITPILLSPHETIQKMQRLQSWQDLLVPDLIDLTEEEQYPQEQDPFDLSARPPSQLATAPPVRQERKPVRRKIKSCHKLKRSIQCESTHINERNRNRLKLQQAIRVHTPGKQNVHLEKPRQRWVANINLTNDVITQHIAQLEADEVTDNNRSDVQESSDKQLDNPVHEETFQSEYTPEVFAELQSQCPEIGPLIVYIRTRVLPRNKRLARKIMVQAESHQFDAQGILCHLKYNTNKKWNQYQEIIWQRVVPVCLRNELVATSHCFHHQGIVVSCEILSRNFYWEKMTSHVKNYVLSCRSCTEGKRGQIQRSAPLKPLPHPAHPFHTIELDFAENLPPTKDGYIHIMTVIDNYSFYVYLVPMRTLTAQEVAQNLIKIFASCGIPSVLITDQAAGLMSSTIQELLTILRVKHVTASPHFHRGTARVERAIRHLNDGLRTLIEKGDQANWDQYLPILEMTYRSSISADRPFSPNLLVHGRELRTALNLVYPIAADTEISGSKTEFVKNLTTRMRELHAIHSTNIEQDKLRMKAQYDAKIKPCCFQIGDIVWRKDETSQHTTRRLQLRFVGPYCLEFFLDDGYSACIRSLTTGKMWKNKVHVNLLKPYRTPLTEEERNNLRKENVVDIETTPQGRTVTMVESETQTESPYPLAPSAASSGVDPPDPPDRVTTGVTPQDLQRAIAPLPIASNDATDIKTSGMTEGLTAGHPPQMEPRSRDLRAQLPTKRVKIPLLSTPEPPGQLKEIIDERFNQGDREFLISRFSDPDTGAPSRPLWVKGKDVPLDLLRKYHSEQIKPVAPRERRAGLRQH